HVVIISMSTIAPTHDSATTVTYTRSLHDALPIWRRWDSNPRYPFGVRSFSKRVPSASRARLRYRLHKLHPKKRQHRKVDTGRIRSEEHTSELQSRENLVCRLLLEKKNVNVPRTSP